MHQFGLPDATVPRDGQEVRETLEAFNKYLLIEKPELRSGHSFSKDADSPRRRLKLTADDRFEPKHLFHNPHGLWQMEEI